MKSRKSDNKRRSGGRNRSTLRNALRTFETLEKRELLAFDPTAMADVAWFNNQEGMNATLAYLEARTGGDGDNWTGGEGGPSDIITLAEQEPNDGFSNSQFVPLGGNGGVNITGRNTNFLDEDWFVADLPAGAVVDARLSVGVNAGPNIPLVSMYNSSNFELIASTAVPTSMPATSPLTGSASSPVNPSDVALHYIIPEAGRYHFRVSDVQGSYTLQLRQYRAPLEEGNFDDRQILYLDFDGATISRPGLFPFLGLPGSARMSPTSSFMAAYGIQDQDYEAYVDEVVARVQAKFDTLGVNTNNPNYGIEIRNSSDHPDPWGGENVSRMVIGGTWQELVGDPAAASSGILGIAQSVDSGNFDTEETAIVMHDVLIQTVNTVPIDPFARRIEVIAELTALVVVHEAGHFFGGWHQDPNNDVLSIMDQFYDPVISSGSGPDGVFGNADDVPVQFQADAYSPGGQPFEPGGMHDVVNALGYALSIGQVGRSTITGNVFNDINENRRRDLGEAGLQAVVWADLNNNGQFEQDSEYFTVSNPDGTYELSVPAGTYTVRQGLPEFYRFTTQDAYTVTIGAGTTVGGINFGNILANPQITGTKFNDVNGNGQRDEGEEGIAGVWIYIDEDGDNRIDIGEPAAQTAEDGTYLLNFSGTGLFTVREVIDSGYVQTLPGPDLDYEYNIVLTGDPAIDIGRISGLDFGNKLTVDFGDAPVSYGDASHGLIDGLRLGTQWDAEQSSQYSADATGDDSTGLVGPGGTVIDDEDALVAPFPLVVGSSSNSITVTAQNSTGQAAFLSSWIDTNQNGVFESSEKVVSDLQIGTGETDVPLPALSGALLGETFIRMRYSYETGLGPTGQSGSGEVEDHVVTITDSLNLAVDDFATVPRNSGPTAIDVLANDFTVPGESFEIVRVSSPTQPGSTVTFNQNLVFYTPASGFIGRDTFTYTIRTSVGDFTANVFVDVSLSFDEPQAIDDSFEVATNSVAVPLNVLANDIEGQNGALSIVSFTQPDKGGRIELGAGNKSLLYTPANGVGDTEVFSYTVSDGVDMSTANVTLHTLPGARADDIVEVRLVATDLNGNPITAIEQGRDFQVRMFVDDLRFDRQNPDPLGAAGVFGAYSDLLYNLQLVTTVPNSDPNSGFNFDVSFFNDFVNATTGDASLPGLIDELGAFSNRPAINEPDPVLLAAVTFSARTPGIASFMADPADDLPNSDVLLFNTPATPVPLELIRYLGTSVEIVGDGTEFPLAVDDSLPSPIDTDAIRFPIDVLANDLPGSTGSISLIDVTNGTLGTARINNGQVEYTPNGAIGVDQFVYTVQDANGFISTATVTVSVGAASANDDIIRKRLELTDLNGNPIEEITVGSEFQLRGYIEDIRGIGLDRGVFAAYEDVLYSANLVSANSILSAQELQAADPDFVYSRVRSGDLRVDGLINEIGAVQDDLQPGNRPVGLGEKLLFIVTMTADSPGVATFIGDPADISPQNDTLIFQPPRPATLDEIDFGFDSIRIVGAGGEGEAFHNSSNPFDVNADGHVSPYDALLLMHRLNNGLQDRGGAEGEGNVMYYDVSNDGFVTPLDALLVVNELNTSAEGESGLVGEGEFAAAQSAGFLAESSIGILSDDPGHLTPEVLLASDSSEHLELGDIDYGAAPSQAHDSVFADEGDEGSDDLFGQLASELADAWNKRA